MAVKQKRINNLSGKSSERPVSPLGACLGTFRIGCKCARCGERETVMRGERGPASIYCDLCRDEVKREQNALRAQAYRQRKASYRG